MKPLIIHYEFISKAVYSQFYIIKNSNECGYILIELYSFEKVFRKIVSSKILTNIIKFGYHISNANRLCYRYATHNITDLSIINSSQLCEDLQIPIDVCEEITKWIKNKIIK